MKSTGQSILGLLVSLIMTAPAFANNNASVASSTTVVQDPRNGSLISGFVQMARSTSLYDYQDGTRKDSMDYIGRIGLKINKDYSLRLDGSYSQDLKDSQADDFGDTSLSLVRTPVPLGSLILLGYKLAAIAPTSKESHVRQNLEGAGSGVLIAQVNPDRLIPGLGIVGSISFRRNFHQYDTALNGTVNTQYTSAQSLSLSYDFTSGISISGDFTHKNGLTYQNNLQESFEHTEELGYTIANTYSIAIGHTNSGNALKANGQDSNLALVDNNNSMIYGSLTVAF